MMTAARCHFNNSFLFFAEGFMGIKEKNTLSVYAMSKQKPLTVFLSVLSHDKWNLDFS
jgi:hypothetical protein